ncbi:hypothetical protein BT67DRAFT_432404 [Trichocladium antarcticum]|uniref:Uncharacterized protein n=1 Tax=Trichocladium antarcticum TaxID=1450529 RepID=A0AAN6UPJ5_9PEZI|nr:hypothetical protein BT67DRAFT_432404 [Trichocladium antarcticum]
MSAPTHEQLLQLSGQVVAFPPDAARRMPSTFLSLAPSTSESYPRTQRVKQAALTAEALAAVPKLESVVTPLAAAEPVPETETMKQRRTSSLSSDSSKSRLRFLKLGPVHWGEHQDDHKADYHDIVDEVAVE